MSGCSFELVFWVSLGIYPDVEMLGHKAVPFLIFLETSILFPTVAVLICIPTDCAQGFPFPHPQQHLLFVDLLMMPF